MEETKVSVWRSRDARRTPPEFALGVVTSRPRPPDRRTICKEFQRPAGPRRSLRHPKAAPRVLGPNGRFQDSRDIGPGGQVLRGAWERPTDAPQLALMANCEDAHLIVPTATEGF